MKSNMTPLKRKIYDNIIEPSIADSRIGGCGIILSYDYIKKTATVRAADQNTGVLVDFYNVPVEDHGRGVELVALKPGTEVWVSFQSSTMPVVTTLFSGRKKKEDLKVHHGPQVPRYLGYMGG